MLSKFSETPQEYAAWVAEAAKSIPRSNLVRIGADAGTWEDRAYLDRLTSLPGLDFIDLHIYPLGKDARLLQRALDAATQGRAAGKRVVINQAALSNLQAG